VSGSAVKFIKLSSRGKVLFLEAVFLHMWIGLLLKFVPFRHIPRLFGSRNYETPAQMPDVVSQVRDAVAGANRVSPWRNRCLVSSLAGRCMLRRRRTGSKLSLGVAKGSDGRIVAHAWLRSGDAEVTAKHGDYQELFVF
jgi:hypothetical protein